MEVSVESVNKLRDENADADALLVASLYVVKSETCDDLENVLM